MCVYILNMWNSSFLNSSSCLVNTRLELEYSKLDFLVGKFFTHLELEISKLKFLGSKFFFFFFFSNGTRVSQTRVPINFTNHPNCFSFHNSQIYQIKHTYHNFPSSLPCPNSLFLLQTQQLSLITLQN